MIYRGPEDLERQVADGKISVHDADEIEHFAEFLRRSAERGAKAQALLYLEMYPTEEK